MALASRGDVRPSESSTWRRGSCGDRGEGGTWRALQELQEFSAIGAVLRGEVSFFFLFFW